MLNSSIPMIESLRCVQFAVLSPSQWPTNFPLPGNVEREMTIPLLLLLDQASLSALKYWYRKLHGRFIPAFQKPKVFFLEPFDDTELGIFS